MKFLVTLDRDEDGVWIAECPAIPGCVSQGKTKEVALANIREAITLCLEVRAEEGLPQPDIQLSGEWRAEIQRRCREIEEGTAVLIDADEVFKEAYRALEHPRF